MQSKNATARSLASAVRECARERKRERRTHVGKEGESEREKREEVFSVAQGGKRERRALPQLDRAERLKKQQEIVCSERNTPAKKSLVFLPANISEAKHRCFISQDTERNVKRNT